MQNRYPVLEFVTEIFLQAYELLLIVRNTCFNVVILLIVY